MQLITKDTGYALRILVYMAAERCRLLSVRQIACRVGIPYAFARRICQTLRKEKIISVKKGKSGGFMFCRRPQDISIRDIIRIFQQDIVFLDCFIKGHLCARVKKCPLRKKFKALEREVAGKLAKITLKDLLKG